MTVLDHALSFINFDLKFRGEESSKPLHTVLKSFVKHKIC